MQNTTKLYACFDVYYDDCDTFPELIWITLDENAAKTWVDSCRRTHTEWRTYSEYKLNEQN